MIPVKLKIKGMYSYKEEQVIDFTELMSDKIFGIFGSVGSGKSTILEAILFSLYGKTERLSQSGENRNYNMMNLKSKELSIDFEFLSNDKKNYKIISVLKRQNKNFEKVSSPERSFYVLKDTEWVPVSQENIEEVVGFNYDNFKRTVIIPQGKFQEFLSLTDGDRGKMLKEIFGLEKFELSRQTGAVLNKTREELNRIKGSIEIIQLDNNQFDLDDLKNQIKILNYEIQSTRQQHFEIKKEAERLEKVQKLSDELKVKKVESLVAQIQRAENEAFKNQLNLFIEYSNLFSALIRESEQINNTIVNHENDIENDAVLLKEAELSLENIRNSYDLIKLEESTIPEKEKEIASLQAVNEVLNLMSKKNQLEVRSLNGKNVLAQSKEKISSLDKKLLESSKELDQINAQKLDINQITKINSQLTACRQLKQIAEKLEKLNQSKNSIIESLGVPNPEEYITSIETEIQNISEDMQKSKVILKLQEMTDLLVEGQPCPLCGSLEHPTPVDFQDDHHSIIDDFNIKISALKQQLKEAKNKINELSNLENNFKTLKEQESELLKEHFSESEKIKIDDIPNLYDHLDTQLKDQTSLEEFSKLIQRNQKDIQNEIQEENDSLKKFEDGLQNIINEIENINGQIKAYSAKFSADYIKENSSVKLNETKIEEMYAFIAETRKKYSEISEIKDAEEKKYAKIDQRINILSEQLKGLKENRLSVLTRLEALMQKHQVEISKVKNVLIWGENIDITAENERLTKLENAFHVLLDRIRFIESELGDSVFNEEEFNTVIQKMHTLAEQLEAKFNMVGGLESSLKKGEESIKLLAELTGKLQIQQNRETNLMTLNQLFRAGGFVHFVSTVYLRNLVELANQRFFHLTKNSLKIELDESNGFLVRDYMNSGHVRHIKTLSGGQIFQASLCLALGLAESVRRFDPGKDNFFFLDEGFGTLDRDSMYMVFETLKMLRREGRVVGVISHVEELQQEIGMHLRVVNTEENGSQITKSWE